MSLADKPVVAYAATFAIALAVVSPALASVPKDSFPLSTFPMFAEGRKDANVTVEHAVAVGAHGEETPIPPRLVGTDEVLQARATIARAIRKGPDDAKDLCRAIAKRVATSGAFDGARQVELRTTRLDAIAWFGADDGAKPDPLSMKRHATCPVDRAATEP